MLTAERVLVIAPHADDESLGCGGLLHRLSGRARPPAVRLLLLSNGDVRLHHGTGDARDVTAAERSREFAAAAALLGADRRELGFPTRGLAAAGGALVAAVEAEAEAFAPDLVLAPGPSFHDDHAAACRAAYAALRPGHCRSARTLLLYETFYYAWAAAGDEFRPNLYCPLGRESVDFKLRLCGLYKSQRLDGPQAQAAVEWHLARRGLEAEPVPPPGGGRVPHAEAFTLARGVITN